MMNKTIFTIGLNDKNTETQIIKTENAKMIIAETLLNEFGIFAFTMIECSGVYKMESTGNIVFENSIRVEIASDEELTEAEAIIESLKIKLNQESIMMENGKADISFR